MLFRPSRVSSSPGSGLATWRLWPCLTTGALPYHARRFGWNPERFGEFSPLQLREFLAQLSFLNEHLAERPKFSLAFRGGRYEILARLPSEPPHLRDHRPEDLGRIVYACCKDVLSACENNTEETVQLVKQGRFTWLFDSNGEFRTDSMVFPE